MSVEVLARFMEQQMFPDRETGLAPGCVPARIVTTDEGERLGFIYNLGKLKNGLAFKAVVYEKRYIIGQEPVDVSWDLRNDPGGKNWLETIEQRYGPILAQISLEQIPFTPLVYTVYPNDFESHSYSRAILESLPEGTIYAKLHPLVKCVNGKWLSSIYYERKVTTVQGESAHYDNQVVEKVDSDGFCPDSSPGVLLGRIDFENLIPIRKGFNSHAKDFDGKDFPFQHYLEVSYPVALRDAHKLNSLSLEIRLAQ